MDIVEQAKKLKETLAESEEIQRDLEQLKHNRNNIKQQCLDCSFVNQATARKMGLSLTDIKQLDEYWLKDNKFPRYSMGDIYKYTQSLKITKKH